MTNITREIEEEEEDESGESEDEQRMKGLNKRVEVSLKRRVEETDQASSHFLSSVKLLK